VAHPKASGVCTSSHAQLRVPKKRKMLRTLFIREKEGKRGKKYEKEGKGDSPDENGKRGNAIASEKPTLFTNAKKKERKREGNQRAHGGHAHVGGGHLGGSGRGRLNGTTRLNRQETGGTRGRKKRGYRGKVVHRAHLNFILGSQMQVRSRGVKTLLKSPSRKGGGKEELGKTGNRILADEKKEQLFWDANRRAGGLESMTGAIGFWGEKRRKGRTASKVAGKGPRFVSVSLPRPEGGKRKNGGGFERGPSPSGDSFVRE